MRLVTPDPQTLQQIRDGWLDPVDPDRGITYRTDGTVELSPEQYEQLRRLADTDKQRGDGLGPVGSIRTVFAGDTAALAISPGAGVAFGDGTPACDAYTRTLMACEAKAENDCAAKAYTAALTAGTGSS